MKKSVLWALCSGAILGITAYGIKKLNDKLDEEFMNMEFDFPNEENIEYEEENKEEGKIPERHYISLNFDNIKQKIDKATSTIKEEVKEVVENKKEIKNILKEATNEIKETILSKEEKEVEVTETYFDEYFSKIIRKDYSKAINIFLADNGKDSLRYVRKYIFNDDGEFDIRALKEQFSAHYNNISSILNSNVFSLPISMLPIENYLEEIETFEHCEDYDTKVMAILSYWMTINESLDNKELI